jgi:type IX secretion system PorP/SprF family membrane protein
MKKALLHILIFSTWSCLAQDIHFSQFNENHSLINPALTGATDPLRASLTYRDQWRSVTTPYKTFGMSFETQLRTSGWKKVDKFRSMTFKEKSIGRFAWGLSVYSDRAGAGTLATTLGNLSMATFIPINRKSFLSIGLQASYVQKSVNNGNLVYPSQYGGFGYDPNLPQNEKMTSVNYNYFGFAGGALWSYGQRENRVASNKQVKANAGFSFYQVTLPHQSFFVDKQTLLMKYIVHGDLLYAPANFNTAVAPSFYMQLQGSSLEMVMGALFKYYISDNSKYTGNIKQSSFGCGLYYRNSDAIIVMVNFERSEQYVIGLSYDINTSRLFNASTGRGSFEITLRYTPPKAFLYQKKVKLVS